MERCHLRLNESLSLLYRRLFQSPQSLLSVPEAQVSPLRDTPNSSPAHPHKHFLPEDYTDPLMSKKPRISHLSSKTSAVKTRPRPSKQMPHKDVTGATEDGRRRNSLDPRKLLDSLSAVCEREAEVAKRLEPTPSAVKDNEPPAAHPQPKSDCPPAPVKVPPLDRHKTRRKKSKHKHKEQVRTE